VRRLLLCALRYGKPFVIDVMDADLWDMVPQLLDAVQPGLLDTLLAGAIMHEAQYMKLVRTGDGHEYTAGSFCAERLARFRFILLTCQRAPESELLARMKVFRVKVDT
jgi:hypothetical protein